jgi:hypothetical protein
VTTPVTILFGTPRVRLTFPAAYSAIVFCISCISSVSVVGAVAEAPAPAVAPTIVPVAEELAALVVAVAVPAAAGSEGLKSFDFMKGLRGPKSKKRRGASAGPLERPWVPNSLSFLKA